MRWLQGRESSWHSAGAHPMDALGKGERRPAKKLMHLLKFLSHLQAFYVKITCINCKGLCSFLHMPSKMVDRMCFTARVKD